MDINNLKLTPHEIKIICVGLRNTSEKIKRQIEYFREMLSHETRSNMYADIYDITKLIEKLESETKNTR